MRAIAGEPAGDGMNPLPPGVSILLDPTSIVIRPLSVRRRLALNQVPKETPIVLIGSRIGARGQLRGVAARSGLRIEREYVVLPSWRSPSFVVEDNVNTLRWLWSTLATVPPGMNSGGRAADLVLRLGRRGPLLALLGWLAPGRVVIARRR
jgi:hypothetical protein